MRIETNAKNQPLRRDPLKTAFKTVYAKDDMTFISYAQNHEDLMLWRALKHIERGFYVDVGANDPVIDSVTYAFYSRAWRGINIEPVPEFYQQLCRERPFDINLGIAAGNFVGEQNLYLIPESGLSTFDQGVAKDLEPKGRTYTQQVVQVVPLDTIFAQNATETIHFLKIDVEGFEDEVLQGLDLRVWRPWILLVEATKPSSSELSAMQWEASVLEADYHFVYFDGINRFYLADEHMELSAAFHSPPNVFDDFVTYKDLQTNEAIQQQLHKIQALEAQTEHFKSHLDLKEGELNAQRSLLDGANQKIYALSDDLEKVHSKNYELVAELNQTHNQKYALLVELNALKDQVNTLTADLRSVQSANEAVSTAFNGAQATISQHETTIESLRVELKKVYRSRSYRITAPFRAIFGAARVQRDRLRKYKQNYRQWYMNRVEPVAYLWILRLRKNKFLVKTKNSVKKNYPGAWRRLRKLVIPSADYGESNTIPAANRVVVSEPDSSELSAREQHYFNLFQQQMDIVKKQPKF